MQAAPVGEAEFAALMAPLGPFGSAPRLAAGVSGGPHSLALALLADRWVRARGGGLLALVADHGLRPESAAEAAGVAARLAALGIEARVLPLRLAPGSGLQERARAGRRAALLVACREAGAPWLLLGHHRADLAETILFRALRGSGAAGLAAMAPVRAEADALVLRPLLEVPPDRLEAVLAAAGLAAVRDPSNHDARFARARLRRALADPAGTGGATAALAEAARAFGRRRARAEAELAARLAAAVRLLPTGQAEIDAAALGADAVAESGLSALVRAVGGGGFAPPGGAVAALRRRGEGTLAGAWLRRRGGRWLLLREPAAAAPAVPAALGAQWDNRFRLGGRGLPGACLGALGAAEAAALRGFAPGLPRAVLTTLATIRRHAVLVAVPALGYPRGECCADCPIAFVPVAGPVTGGAEWAGRAAH